MTEEERKTIEFLQKEYKKLIEEGNILFPLYKNQANTILNLIAKLQKENERQIEKRNNQRVELTILNEKQKEMNKLINDVKSHNGQFKRQEKEIQKYKYLYQKALDNTIKSDKENMQLKRQIDLMANFISKYHCFEVTVYDLDDKCIHEHECKECIKQYFENKAKE